LLKLVLVVNDTKFALEVLSMILLIFGYIFYVFFIKARVITVVHFQLNNMVFNLFFYKKPMIFVLF
jgi:hypothetical protein